MPLKTALQYVDASDVRHFSIVHHSHGQAKMIDNSCPISLSLQMRDHARDGHRMILC